MKKRITALLAAGLLLLQCTPLSAFADVIEVTPGNMVFLDVTDTAGNSVEGVKVSLYNAAGTEIGGIYNDRYFFESNSSGIDGTELGSRYCYYVPWNSFTPHVAPQTLHSIHEYRADWEKLGYTLYANEPVFINSGIPYEMELYSYDASQPTALTVPANQFGIYVDPKWTKRTAVGFVTTPMLTYYFNRKGAMGALEAMTTIPIGEVRLYDAFNPDYNAAIGLDYGDGGGSSSSHPVEISSAPTQYVLCRLPLQQLCSQFNPDGTYETNGVVYDLRQDTKYAHAILVIQSGSMLTAAIPDANGYVEFYLERTSREYSLTYSYSFDNIPNNIGTTSSGGSGFSDLGTAANLTTLFLQPPALPEDEIILTYVPAGTYTLVYDKIPKGYTAPKTTTITVTNSTEIQHISLVLGDAPLLGDVNLDKVVNAADAAILLTAAAAAGTGAQSGLTDAQTAVSDLNQDGASDARDAALILQYAAYAGAGGKGTIEEFIANQN